MTKTYTPISLPLISPDLKAEKEDFLQQDEQEFLQSLESQLDLLMVDPAELIINEIMAYAKSNRP